MFCKKGVPRNFANFTGKHLCQSLFFNKHCVKSVCIRSYSGPHFPAFGLNTGRYSVYLRIQSKCRKMWTRITPNMDTFSQWKLQALACNFIKKETLEQVLFYELCEISKNTFSYRTPPLTASKKSPSVSIQVQQLPI